MGRHAVLSWTVATCLIGLVLASEMTASGMPAGVAPTVLPPAADLESTVNMEAAPETAEKFTFQAEVNRLMDIIINSLYSNRDIFLRELISNASDALDKVRFLSLVKAARSDGGSPSSSTEADDQDANLEIKISADKDAGILQISDTGVGMSRDELIKNLGTIAKSGTSSFLDKIGTAAKDAALKSDKNGASNLIGQFGVGFYSAYLVADKVRVESRIQGGNVNVWESGAEENFVVYDGKNDGFPEHGTRITLSLKEDAKEYVDQEKLKELIQKFSQFINFPIYLRTQEEIQVPIPDDGEKEKSDPEAGDSKSKDEVVTDDDEISVEDDDEDSPKDPDAEDGKPTTRTETRLSWARMNENKPIWMRDTSELSSEDYEKFYDGIAKMPGKPLAHTHFKGEGEVEFRSILYIPDKPPVGLYSGSSEAEKDAIRLYVRRVLVTDKFEAGLLPRYLGFLLGIVDSDDLPINISREMLQKSKTLDIIKRKLIRKALEMIKSLVKEEEGEVAKEDGKKDGGGKGGTTTENEKAAASDKDVGDPETTDDTASDDAGAEKPKGTRPYLKFWKEYGRMLKLGVIEDSSNRARLAKLLRFRTSKSNLDDPHDWSSLDQYLDRMKSDQDHIYHHSGESEKDIESSPFLEKLLKKGYEVIYLTEPIDEHMITQLPDYEGSKFMSASKDNFKFGEKDQKEEKSKTDALRKTYKPLTKFLKEHLAEKVSKVKLSTRLSDTPCVLSNEQWGYSARMEIMMKAQAFADPNSFDHMMPKTKIMELNPHHPIIRKMLQMVSEAKDTEKDQAKEIEERVMELGHLVYDTALVSSGYLMQEHGKFAERMYRLLANSVDVDPNAKVEEVLPNEKDTVKADEADAKEEFDPDDFDMDDMMAKASASTSAKVDNADETKNEEHVDASGGSEEHDEL
jgi:heat shock protein 90kDa beta